MLYLDVPWCIYQDLSGTSIYIYVCVYIHIYIYIFLLSLVNRIILGLQGLARTWLSFFSPRPGPGLREPLVKAHPSSGWHNGSFRVQWSMSWGKFMKIQALSKQTNAGNRSQKHSKAYLQYYLLPTGTAIAHCTNKSKKILKKNIKKTQESELPPWDLPSVAPSRCAPCAISAVGGASGAASFSGLLKYQS